MNAVPLGPEESVVSPGAGIPGSHQMLHVDAGS